MRRRGVLPLLLLPLALSAGAAAAEAGCAPQRFEDTDYTVCRFDLREERLRLYSLDAAGEPYGSFDALEADLRGRGLELVFAMNAGMFGEDLKPIGLYVQEGQRLKKANRRDGPGNFHLKPNGVFYIDGDRGGVMETEAYLAAGLSPRYASQSGPMLVIDGKIHPKFSETGTSYQRRNGVGAPDPHTLIFAISETGVNFHSFARLFRDGLNCPNALFLDGSISSLHARELSRSDYYFEIGPMVALVRER
jgi:uncharacterized protein YigE (DUF2233 family)